MEFGNDHKVDSMVWVHKQIKGCFQTGKAFHVRKKESSHIQIDT